LLKVQIKKEFFMKKILNTALIAIVFSAMMVDTISARYVTSEEAAGAGAAVEETVTTPRRTRVAYRRGRRAAPARRGRRGRGAAKMRVEAKNLKAAIQVAQESTDPKVKAEAVKTANELAQELLADLQERTWAGDVFGKYTAEQVEKAGAKYTALAIQKDQLMKDIETKQAELDAMSTKRLIFWTKAEGGKEEAHKVASQELAEMKNTLRNINKAMRDQAVIAGKEYTATIRMAIGALTAATLASLAYGIDKYATGGIYTGKVKQFGEDVITGARGQYKELTEQGAREFTRTKVKNLGVTINGYYDSFAGWLKDKREALRSLSGAEKQQLQDLLTENARLKQELEAANAKLAKDPQNENLLNEQQQTKETLQENINEVEQMTEEETEEPRSYLRRASDYFKKKLSSPTTSVEIDAGV
jgi:hypothetical protein